MDRITVTGANEHNLQDVSLEIPRDSLVVITGLSGSGKSSLAFDTIYQEGQRRFMESLSAYARQFLGQMTRPKVEQVDGLSPTLCIDQKTVNRNPRSTVGTITEILDHLRLLMARLGTARCPECLRHIESLSPGQIADYLLREHGGEKLTIMAPIVQDRKGEYRKEMAEALGRGFLRARIDGEMRSLEEDISLARYEKHTIELVMDRLPADLERRPRLVEAIERALKESEGVITALIGEKHQVFSSQRACPEHGISLPEMEPRLFSFNAPQGMCLECSGIGWLEDFDLALLIDPDATAERALRLLQQDERVPFSSLSRDAIRTVCKKLGISLTKKWKQLSDADRKALLEGGVIAHYTFQKEDERGRRTTHTRTWTGMMPVIRHVWQFTQLKRLAGYRRRISCPKCQGKRLNPIALAVDFRGQGVAQLSGMTVAAAVAFFEQVKLTPAEAPIGAPILKELKARLAFLDQVGLSYLALDRPASTLSGGESQRIRLAGQVGAGLQGVTYVLDEPSIGLHGRDQSRLLDALERLRDQGNTILVVEHDTATMARADFLIEIGPGAGREGGKLTAAGTPGRFMRSNALTAKFLRGEERIPLPALRRRGDGRTLTLRGARSNNLQNVDFSVPLGTFTVVTGVSGSGKSTLVTATLARALAMRLHGAAAAPGDHAGIDGLEEVDKLVEIDQSPIGRTPRSNPATYTGVWEPIRELFADVVESRRRGYTRSRFSFNVQGEKGGGRCEECEGAGVKTIEMQFLADVEIPCERCGGKRFDAETLEIRYKGRTIHEILEMTVAEAAVFFENHKKIHRIFALLCEVGLGYLPLGQPSTTVSGGEAQRIKLASELHRPSTGKTLYVLDEPTTGLHMADVRRLLAALNALVDAGNTVLVIEHNTDVIKVADHLVDMGPEGGAGGGRVVGVGTPEQIARLDTPTGRLLAEVLAAEEAPAMAAEPLPRIRRKKTYHNDIRLRGARTHNLQGVDLDLPQGKLTVITGPSGSGKTSLAFDTLFAEGQRRYVESLSTYARRFLGRMQRPPTDSVDGLAPAIAIDQRNSGHNPRSTVATVTEIYDGLRLLYSRIGRPFCPHCAAPVRAYSPSAAAAHLQESAAGNGWLLADIRGEIGAGELMREGFTRVLDGKGEERELTDPAEILPATQAGGLRLVIDRLHPARSSRARLAEAVSVAYGYGADRARFRHRQGGKEILLSRKAECPTHGQVLPEELTPRHFSFNAHIGACVSCGGLGKHEALDPELLLRHPDQPLLAALDPRVSAVLARSPKSRALIEAVFARFKVDQATPVKDWSRTLRRAILRGLPDELPVKGKADERVWGGLIPLIESWTVRISGLRRITACSACDGGRLKPELLSITLGDAAGEPPGMSISDTCRLTVDQALSFWRELRLTPHEQAIAEQALTDLTDRLRFLSDVGLGYLTLDRSAETLSGGEAQRIRLATQLGSRLTGTLYVLDEPTIGLHPRDTDRLLDTLEGLRDLGNTLVVVEHDPAVMNRADHLVDMGPGAGEHGGRILATGTPAQIAGGTTVTGQFLSGRRVIPSPSKRRKPRGWIEVGPSSAHNLKAVKAGFPRGCLSVVTGVSGSGKSTLVLDVLAPELDARIQREEPGLPSRLVVVDQHPIGRTPRSTPMTYCDLLTPIRTLFAAVPLARQRGYGPGRFSYNVAEGRCSHCEGRGSVLVEMHFLSDVWLTCEHCSGRRFTRETLDIRYKGLSIADVMDLTVDDALAVFAKHRKLSQQLSALSEVGLGYIRLGQPANTFSGGEAQRLKLARELAVGKRAPETCFLLDEPTTGLHFSDVEKLLAVLQRLVDHGHMVVLIEHHLDVIRGADFLIDMGPEGGAGGGQVVAAGTPEAVTAEAPRTGSWTGRALAGTLREPAPDALQGDDPRPAALSVPLAVIQG